MKTIYGVFTGKTVYVGSTDNPERRRLEHFKALQKGNHPSRSLQMAYNGQGSFRVLEVIAGEQEWMERLAGEGYVLANVNRAPSMKAARKRRVKGTFIPLLVHHPARKNRP